MKTFPLTPASLLVVACLGLPFATQAEQAQSTQSLEADRKKIETLSTTDTNFISKKEMVEKALKEGQARDEFRVNAEMYSMENTAIKSKTTKLDSERELMVKEFILDNVPTHIIAAGEKSINNYIESHFIDNAADAPTNKAPRVIWSSTDSALSKPVPQDTWTPLPQSASATVAQPQPMPKQPEENKVVVAIDQSKDKSLSSEQSDAVKKLGMTEEDLLAMLNPKEPPVKQKPKSSNSHDGVKVNKIQVTRIVMMGKSKFADISVDATEIKDGQQRKLSSDIQKLEQGNFFNIEDTKFEVIALNEDQIIIENVATKKTFKSTIQ